MKSPRSWKLSMVKRGISHKLEISHTCFDHLKPFATKSIMINSLRMSQNNVKRREIFIYIYIVTIQSAFWLSFAWPWASWPIYALPWNQLALENHPKTIPCKIKLQFCSNGSLKLNVTWKWTMLRDHNTCPGSGPHHGNVWGDFWTQSVEIPMFSSPTKSMCTCSSFSLLLFLNVFSRFFLINQSCSWSLQLQPVHL